jgi:hypothetical protein
MRPVTRNLVVGILAVVALLLALGALPGYLAAGDPYYVTATTVEDDRPSVDVTNLSERRFPYVTEAVETGRSEPYYRGPLGLKGSFTHSPFDEFDALEQRAGNDTAGAVDGTTAYVTKDGTVYRLDLVQDDDS